MMTMFEISIAFFLMATSAAGFDYVEIVNTFPCKEETTCVTLSACLSNITSCLTSDTNASFIEEVYTVGDLDRPNSNFHIVRDVTELVLAGNNSIIQCVQRTSFAFINVTNLTIQGLTFNECGAMVPEEMQSQLHLTQSENSGFFTSPDSRVTLLLGKVDGLSLLGTEVKHSYGYGLLIVDSLWITISNSIFSYNNHQVLGCYQGTYINESCCRNLASPDSSRGNCNGGNLVIISTDTVTRKLDTQVIINTTSIEHGVNLDNQRHFNENYTYTSGGLSIFTGHSLYSESVIISHCTLANNIGLNSGNAVLYIHDNIKSHYKIRVMQTTIVDGNAGLERFAKTAQSGGLTVKYGYKNSPSESTFAPIVNKIVVIKNTLFRGNRGFTAAAIFFQSHIVRDKNMMAYLRMNNVTITENVGYNTIVSISSNPGNRNYDVRLSLNLLTLTDNRLTSQVTIADRLITYHQIPHISTLHLEGIFEVVLTSITIEGNQLRGLSLADFITGRVTFQQTNIIADNSGMNGGGMLLYSRTRIRLYHSARIHLINNTASLSGGAIYVRRRTIRSLSSPYCFFGVPIQECRSLAPLKECILLRNNTAAVSGNSIYGGSLEVCQFPECQGESGVSLLQRVFDIPWNESLTEVTSDADKICFCSDGEPHCELNAVQLSTHPGGHIRIAAVGVGQLNGTNPVVVASTTVSSNILIGEQDAQQQLGVTCKNLNYSIRAQENVRSEIRLSLAFNDGETRNRTILVNVTKCPLGFTLAHETQTCSCIALLKEHGVSCFLDSQTFHRPAAVWIGFNETTGNFLAHSKCPFHKCRQEASLFSLSSTNTQCEVGFSGVLCGRCTTNLSITLGSMACKKCSNGFSVLVVALFILSGPLMIIVMMLCDITVEKGTFNGAILFANLIHIHRSLLFGPNHSSVITVPIAWMNLDLGFNLCFYDGMDAYTRQWLQYLFPLYVILIAWILVCFNWYTRLGAKFIRNNISNVFSTLLLLCYTKLLRTVAEAFSFTTIYSSQGNSIKVWLYDGNIPYMEGRHLALFIVALAVLLCLLLPFTLLLLLEYPLLQLGAQRTLRKLRLLPLIFAYQKPFKTSCRWWTGLMLLFRVVLVSMYQASLTGYPRLNFIAIVTVGLCILGTMWNLGSLYKNRYITCIEAFFLTDLIILASWSEYVATQDSSNRLIPSYILVTAALLVFMLLVLRPALSYFIRRCVRKRRGNGDQLENSSLTMAKVADAGNTPSSTYIRVTGDQLPLTHQLQNNS